MLDDWGYVSVGVSQHSNHEPEAHPEGTPYLPQAPHRTTGFIWTTSASIPDHSAIPSSQMPYHSPRLIEGSASLTVCNSDLAPTDNNQGEPGHSHAEGPVNTKRSHSAINLTETPGTIVTTHLEFPESRSHNSYPPSNSPLNFVDSAQVISPNHHSCSSTVSSLPVMLPPSQQWHDNNKSLGSAESGTTNVGHTSLLDSESSTAVEKLAGEWWDCDWNSDSLYSSDNEDENPSLNHDIGLYHDEPVDGSHLELGVERPEGNKPQFEYWNDFSYNPDGTGLKSDDRKDSLDYSPDSEYDKQVDHHIDHEEAGAEYDLGEGIDHLLEEEDESFIKNMEDELGYGSDGGSNYSPGYEGPYDDDEYFEDKVEHGVGDPYEDD
ncbi:hypothetical protein PQX77_014225 [Marasmius sp. AFHP31]|nr:hypothetical protein PQX77_014225 [Marasmius sp. AFHP31]